MMVTQMIMTARNFDLSSGVRVAGLSVACFESPLDISQMGGGGVVLMRRGVI